MLNPPLVSVIVPLYNKEKYIRRTLDYLIRQTYENWECILINDGSTDNSLNIIEEISQKYPDKFLVISQENSGQSGARNVGLSVAKGKYIAFLDADDIWHPNKLNSQVSFLEAHTNYVMTLCSYSIRQKMRPKRVIRHRNVSQMLRGWVYFTGYGGGLESVALINYFALSGLQFDINLSTSAGLDFCLRIADLGPIHLDKEVLMEYQKYPGQFHGNFLELRRNTEYLYRKHFPDTFEEKIRSFARYQRLVDMKSAIATKNFSYIRKIFKINDIPYLSIKIFLYWVSVMRGIRKI